MTVTDNAAPFSLYEDEDGRVAGEGLPAGSYTLTATAYPEADGGGTALGTLTVSFTVAAVDPEALTGNFTVVPAAHEGAGSGAFVLKLQFSEEPELSYSVLRNQSLAMTDGSLGFVRRLNPPLNTGWKIKVRPSGWDDVTVTLAGGRACGTEGAVCTEDGKVLANTAVATVPGPLALSVGDVRVDEGAQAVLAFPVTLNRAAAVTVTVDYATADGTATAGADYTATSDTLTFTPGETEKTVNVAVLDDTHADSEETLTLALSNATGARIRDAEATGTIVNSDPIPRAWLARFGRTVADHVVDAVTERLKGSPGGGLQVTLGGQRIPLDTSPGGSDRRENRGADTLAAFAARISDDGAGTGWGEGGGEDVAKGPVSRPLTGRELLLGSAFSLTGETPAGGTAGFWGRAAVSGFDGREGDLSLDGEVTTGLLGADYARGRWRVGLIASHSRGEGGYRGADSGTVSSTLTGVHPWARYAVSERLSVWGVAGYGAGTLTLEPEPEGGNQGAMKAGLSLAMAAAGARGELVEPPGEAGGPALALVTDAMFVRTDSESAAGLPASSAEVTRLRLTLDSSWRFAFENGSALTPSIEAGLRHDGGDAESGIGVELGGGLAFAAPKRGLTFDLSARTLLAHEASGFRERGLTAALTWDPLPSTDRGLAVSLRQTLGAASAGGTDALMGRETLAGLGATDTGGARRLELTAGYGVAMFGGRYTGTPELGIGLSDTGRDYRLGWRLGLGSSGGASFELGIEATRRESANHNKAEHAVGFRIGATW